MTLQGPNIAKCWELIGTIALEKVLWAIGFVKIGYWAPKAQKYQSSSKKGPKGFQNKKICNISDIITLQGLKIGKYWDLIGTIALEKVL